MPGGDPYIKGYLRAYAKKLGIDPDFIVERYSANLINKKVTPSIKPARGKDHLCYIQEVHSSSCSFLIIFIVYLPFSFMLRRSVS